MTWMRNYTPWIYGFLGTYFERNSVSPPITHWGRTTHICVGKLTIVGSDDGLSPGRRQAIIWTNAGIWTLGNKFQWNFNRNSNIFIEENTFENVVCETLFISSRPQCDNLTWLCSTFCLFKVVTDIGSWMATYNFPHITSLSIHQWLFCGNIRLP